jgi:Domain of unknown function (DUF5919)
MPSFSKAAQVIRDAAFVSVIVFLVGVILLLISYVIKDLALPPTLLSEISRDLGIVLCSVGLISVLYEMLIRRQLIEDYHTALRDILDPDTKRLGIRALFRNRDDKTARGRSLDAVLRATRKEMLCFGLGFYRFLEKRELLLEKMKDGCQFKFLIFNPKSRHAKALDESLGYANSGLLRHLEERHGSFDHFIKVVARERFADRLEVRTYDSVPTFGALMIDSSTPQGFLIIELYGSGVEGDRCPGMELVPRENCWYSFYEPQITEL